MEELLGLAHLAALQVPTSVASRSMPLAITASVAKNTAWRSRGITWVETGSGATRASRRRTPPPRGSRWAKVPTAPGIAATAISARARQQPLAAAGELGVVAGELQTEGGRFGMDAMAAADRQRVLVLERAPLQRRQHRIQVLQQQVGRLGELHRQAGVQHVGAGHAQMHEAAVGADGLGEPGEEGDHVMAGLALDRVDPSMSAGPMAASLAPPFSRIVRAALAGIVPIRAMPSAARASISNQIRIAVLGDQIAAISGRV